MFSTMKKEIAVVFERNPAARSIPEIVFLYTGFYAIMNHCLDHWFYTRKRFFLVHLVPHFGRFIKEIVIRPGAIIGKCCL